MKINSFLEKISREETISLLQEMIRTNTVNPPGNEKILAEKLKKKLEQFEIDSQVVDLGDNRANVIGVIKGTGEKRGLLLNGHLDTVPPGSVQWNQGPFSGIIVDNKIYGRGSADMKGGLAAMIMAAGAIKRSGISLKGDLIIAATAGEEIDSIGAFHYLNTTGLKNVGAIIIGEPTSCKIKVAEKGVLWLEITTYGKTSHGAFPQKGINAIVNMNMLLNEILNYRFNFEKNELLGEPTLNISTIDGGVKTNVVPDKCTITIDIRTVPSMDHDNVIKDIENIIEKLKTRREGFKAELKVLNNRPAVETKANHSFIKLDQEVAKKVFDKDLEPEGVSFYTDASVFLPATNLPAIIYGPGDSDMAHQPNEYIHSDDLWEAVQFYIGMIVEYLV